jgi:predicted DsbA family dithiol-disulfide isomerase
VPAKQQQCWFGSRRLHKAIALYQKTYPGGSSDAFNIAWKPYYLDPDAPSTGWPLLGKRLPGKKYTKNIPLHARQNLTWPVEKMLSRVPAERAAKFQSHMKAVATADGINLKFGGKTGNTKRSHQLMLAAGQQSLETQGRLAEEIFRRCYEEEGDITDAQMLTQAGVAAGLDEEVVKRALDDAELGDIVDAEVEEVKKLGVKGVPQFFLQDGQHHIEGAADVMDFFEVFVKVKEGNAQEGGTTASGYSC